ncbi:MAG: hypothetical protein MI919_27375 [Holophagales bacterium]|nr:hypothetical protein [Holophagales bacterium]
MRTASRTFETQLHTRPSGRRRGWRARRPGGDSVAWVVFATALLLWACALAGPLPASARATAGQDPAGGEETTVSGIDAPAPRVPAPEENPVSPVRRIERGPLAPSQSSSPLNGTSQTAPSQTDPSQTGGNPEQNGNGGGNGGPGGGGPGDGPGGGGGDRVRTIDGSGNNRRNPAIGQAGRPLIRLLSADYGDGVSQPAGAGRPSARQVSNLVCDQEHDRPNALSVTDYLWQWGQFLDHDIDLTDGADPVEPFDIAVPAGDPWFDPSGSGEVTIPLNRSIYDPDSGTTVENPRQQLNEITAWIDASNVYGSDEERARALRTLDGSGRLKTSEGDLLPFNEEGLPNAGGPSPSLFLAGDVRANEQLGLTAMHTLFVREHNRLAGRIAERDPDLDGDAVSERARAQVGAPMQVITYREFLPALLGPDALAPYRGYRPEVDASIANLFSTAAYRFGHSTLSTTILRLDAQGAEIAAGHLPLRDAFFAPQRLASEGGIDPILRGLAAQTCQAVDAFVVDDLRNFLFGPPGAGGFDLAALNIQRGRDHGLPSYQRARQAFGMPEALTFGDITSDPELQERLRTAYGDVGAVDLWVGGLAEDPRPGAMVGELLFRILKEQFEALRDGDRFWYRRAFDGERLRRLERTRLADIIRRNTEIADELQNDVFHLPGADPGG